jgi:hypothetical protein
MNPNRPGAPGAPAAATPPAPPSAPRDPATERLREDLIHPDPLLDCLLEVCRLHGVASSRAALSAGLPLENGRLTLAETQAATPIMTIIASTLRAMLARRTLRWLTTITRACSSMLRATSCSTSSIASIFSVIVLNQTWGSTFGPLSADFS